MSHHLVEADRLAYTYPDGTAAITDISFTITHGESVGIIGANGAGKSTLLLLLVGCLFADKGAVRIGEAAVTPRSVGAIRGRIGMVFQNPEDQLFMPTVRDDVAFGPRNQGLNEADVERKVGEALASVDAAHLADRPPYRLSGGEKRAVSIATVLSMAPDILILDEPSAALDPRSRRDLIGLLQGFEHTRIIASHDLDLIRDVCRRVILVCEGRVACDAPADEVLANRDLLEQCGL